MNVYLKKQSFRWQKMVISCIALFLCIGILNIFQAPIKNSFYSVVSPLSKTFWRAGDGTSGFFEYFLDASSLVQQNNNLKEENQNLLSQVSLLQETANQNQSMYEAVENTKADNFTMVLAGTVGLDVVGDYMVLNKGSADGIKENMPVISAQKVLYGKVVNVYKNFSKIMLISNKASVLDARIVPMLVEDTALPPVDGVIKGSGALSMYLDLVSSDAPMSEGDALITSGLEGVFPKNLLVGKIIEKEQSDSKPFQTAKVEPFLNVKNTENLFIITNYMQK